MSDISYSYTRKRKDFGRIVDFHPYDPDLLCECTPNPEQRSQYVALDPYESEIQNIPVLTESQTNTERISLKPHGQVHNEGGWPLAIDPTEFEEKMKYCKKAERDELYYASCKSLVEKCTESYLKQNNAIDIYGSYWPEVSVQEAPNLGPSSVKAVTVFKDPSPVKRTVAALSWLGDGKKLAVAYCNLRFQGGTDATSTSSHIWDVLNPNEPIESLNPASPLCSIEYYTKDPHLIAGGSYNGVVQYWDTRQPNRPASRSLIKESHKDPVWALKWLQSKSGEILSVSTDGQAFIWDCRTPEKPVEIKKLDNESLILQPKNNEGGSKHVLGGLCIDYDAQVGGPAKYMIGTEQGTILSCNRKGKSMHEKLGANTFNGHHGPVYAVQRNPHHPKFFLSIGDWTARLWFEDFKISPMYQTFYHKAHLTYGCWHPARTGVFFTTRMDGVVDVWDLIHRQGSPIISLQVSDYALHCIRPTNEGRHLATGAVDGSVTLLELSPSLYTIGKDEKSYMGKMFENESLRDKNLEKSAKEKKLLQKKQQRHSGGQEREVGIDDSKLQELASKYIKNVQDDGHKEENSNEDLSKNRTKLMDDISEGLEIDD